MGHPYPSSPFAVAYGMGVDSTAMLIGLHDRGTPAPDAILFADTGGEKPATYAYLPVINAWLASVDWPEVTVVRRAPTQGRFGSYGETGNEANLSTFFPNWARERDQSVRARRRTS